MVSPLNYIINYDYETGGLDSEVNPPTEVAMVVIDAKTLEIVEEFSAMFRPRLDLSFIQENSKKEANRIFKELSYKEEETNLKRMEYKGELITPRNIADLCSDIETFRAFLVERKSFIIEYEEYLELLETEHAPIAEVFFNLCYNPQALTVTHMSIEMLLNEGLPASDVYYKMMDIVNKYTNGVHKPILAGHKIHDFDNHFLVKGFKIIGVDIMQKVSWFMFDTLLFSHLKWNESPFYNLGTVANALGLTLKEAHRALPDTIANAKVVIAMIRNLRGEGQGESEYVRKKFNLNY